MSKPINIAVIAPYKIYPAVSGGQRCTAFLYKYLSALLPVTMISVKGNEGADTERIRIHNILGSSKLRYINLLLFFRLRKFLSEEKISDLILEHPYMGWLGWLLKISCGIKLTVHSHNIEGVRFKELGKWWWGILYNYERWVHRRADLNFFITPEDLEYAVKHFKLKKEKCILVTYGTENSAAPASEEKIAAAALLRQTHSIEREEKIILFNGMLDYRPNLEAVNFILEELNPLLLKDPLFRYKIIICGKGLPASFQDLSSYTGQNIIYAGFVKDINLYFLGADIFINPIKEGGGIKTKLTEALGMGLTAISTVTGAIGISVEVTGKKMTVVPDNDIDAFAEAIVHANPGTATPQKFFNHFYWGNIAANAASSLEDQHRIL